MSLFEVLDGIVEYLKVTMIRFARRKRNKIPGSIHLLLINSFIPCN